MQLPQEGYLLRVFIGEADKVEHKPLYEWIVLKAREQGLAGATVLRGMMGFGANTRQIHTFRFDTLSEDLPIIVEIVDTLCWGLFRNGLNGDAGFPSAINVKIVAVQGSITIYTTHGNLCHYNIQCTRSTAQLRGYVLPEVADGLRRARAEPGGEAN